MRSKVLLVASIFSTIYVGILMFVFGKPIFYAIESGTVDVFVAYFKIFGLNYDLVNIVTLIVVLLSIHIILFIFGMFMGWIGFLAKKSGISKFVAILYLIGTICFPLYFVFGLPVTVLQFVGCSKQKKINRTMVS